MSGPQNNYRGDDVDYLPSDAETRIQEFIYDLYSTNYEEEKEERIEEDDD